MLKIEELDDDLETGDIVLWAHQIRWRQFQDLPCEVAVWGVRSVWEKRNGPFAPLGRVEAWARIFLSAVYKLNLVRFVLSLTLAMY
jgi:hypothetical protein